MYNILIVDDERIERNGIIMLLKRLSINAGIVEAANGKEAYEYLCSDEAEHIDILLTDVKMPFMDGITLIKKLNEDNIKLKTIIFSGYNEFEYAKLAVKLGVKDYILKPVDPVEFENTIKKVCAELEKLHNYIFGKTGQFMYAAVSDIIDDYHRISDMMDELENLMSNKFYQTNNYIFTNDISDKMPVFVQIDDDVLMKQMKQDIKMKDVTFLRIHFDALCKKYRSQSNFSHIYIKFVFSNLLKDFYDALPGANEDEFASQIDKLYTSEDFNCIMDIVNHNIDILEKSFISNPLTMHREIETVKEYIHNHYSEELGAQQLADMVYLAPSYLSSLFKKETGQNLSKYIKQYRMEKAKELLTDTNMKIVNISEKTGYPNVSYFCQSFREYFGVSPQKFRDKGEVL